MIKEKLDKIILAMQNINCDSSNILSEGRMNSLKDEKNIINYLKNNLLTKDFIVETKDRSTADFFIQNDDKLIPVNIKTTKGKSCDNVFSKIGFLYAFTSLECQDIKKSLSWSEFTKLLIQYKSNVNEDKDYYFMVCNKNDLRDCFIRGSKKINEYKSNPSNILQINWDKEKSLSSCTRTYDESFNYIFNIIKKSLIEDINKKQSLINIIKDEQ